MILRKYNKNINIFHGYINNIYFLKFYQYYLIKIIRILTLISLKVNKNRTMSIFSFFTASLNAVQKEKSI